MAYQNINEIVISGGSDIIDFSWVDNPNGIRLAQINCSCDDAFIENYLMVPARSINREIHDYDLKGRTD